MQIQA
jgi:hypothetical protein